MTDPLYPTILHGVTPGTTRLKSLSEKSLRRENVGVIEFTYTVTHPSNNYCRGVQHLLPGDVSVQNSDHELWWRRTRTPLPNRLLDRNSLYTNIIRVKLHRTRNPHPWDP